jgi:DNA-directed RNA polymerase subunit RPC12/RpoP
MWFVVFWSRAARKVEAGQGYFNCPLCQRRRRCVLSQVESRPYLYGIIPLPVGEIVGPEYYRCLDCKREWSSELGFGYDFGTHAETQPWKCFKCGKEVPYESFECPHCGYRLEVGGRY